MLKYQIDSVFGLTKLGFRWFAFYHFERVGVSLGFIVIRIFSHEERSNYISYIWAKSLGNCSLIIDVHKDPNFFKFAHVAVFHSSYVVFNINYIVFIFLSHLNVNSELEIFIKLFNICKNSFFLLKVFIKVTFISYISKNTKVLGQKLISCVCNVNLNRMHQSMIVSICFIIRLKIILADISLN